MKHANIITKLTLEQKCALLSGETVFTTRGYKNAGIPSITLSDGPNGVRKQAGAADHLGLNPSVPATCFPTAATVACSWDPALGEQLGRAMGEEAAAQELKAFTKVWLEAGESKTVTLPLDDKAFRYWNTKTDSWEVEGGTYELRVGASSADIRLTAAVEVNGTSAPNPYAGKALPHYTSGKVQRVPDDEWEILLGRPIPADTVKIDRNMTLGELNHSRSPLCWLVWAVLTMMLNASYKRGKPNLNVMFQYNMPLRALAKMTSGAISMGMVDGIVLEAKGFWVIGLLKVIVEAVKNIILNAQLESRLRNS